MTKFLLFSFCSVLALSGCNRTNADDAGIASVSASDQANEKGGGVLSWPSDDVMAIRLSKKWDIKDYAKCKVVAEQAMTLASLTDQTDPSAESRAAVAGAKVVQSKIETVHNLVNPTGNKSLDDAALMNYAVEYRSKSPADRNADLNQCLNDIENARNA